MRNNTSRRLVADELLHKTDDAARLRIDGRSVWVPLSLSEDLNSYEIGAVSFEFQLPHWKVEDLGLEAYIVDD